MSQAMKGYKARGVVLSTVKYGDSGMVVQMLTDRYGRQSYMVQGAFYRDIARGVLIYMDSYRES